MTPTHEQALVIFARAPIPGKVKTRLLPTFTPGEACEIHVAMLEDVVERARRAVGRETAISVAWSERGAGHAQTGPGSAAAAGDSASPQPGSVGSGHGIGVMDRTPSSSTSSDRASVAPAGIPTSIQPGGDLGERMALVIQEKLRSGFRRVVILGSDAPTLPDDHLRSAFEHLRRVEVVIGPAEDGGYYLVGMTRLHPEIFMKIRWGTPEVLGVTRKRLKQAGVAFAELGQWHDVDTEADVTKLWRDLLKMKQRHPEEVPPRTWTVLSRLAPGRMQP